MSKMKLETLTSLHIGSGNMLQKDSYRKTATLFLAKMPKIFPLLVLLIRARCSLS